MNIGKSVNPSPQSKQRTFLSPQEVPLWFYHSPATNILISTREFSFAYSWISYKYKEYAFFCVWFGSTSFFWDSSILLCLSHSFLHSFLSPETITVWIHCNVYSLSCWRVFELFLVWGYYEKKHQINIHIYVFL